MSTAALDEVRQYLVCVVLTQRNREVARQGHSSFFCCKTDHLRRHAGGRSHVGSGTARQILFCQQTGRQRVGCPARHQFRRLFREHQLQPQVVEQGSRQHYREAEAVLRGVSVFATRDNKGSKRKVDFLSIEPPKRLKSPDLSRF